jgi:hypothetical protein
MNDLILKYIFTDRGGNEVYTIYNPTDTEFNNPLGQLRMKYGGEDGASVSVEWSAIATGYQDGDF